MLSSRQALEYAQKDLLEAGCDNAHNEARWMLEELARRFDLARHESLPEIARNELTNMLQRRRQGEPLQYILGNVDFHEINLQVGSGVLIPRPETELLVELAIQLYPGSGCILDLCTGSGAIALALAHQLPDCRCIVASDISPEALHWAEINLRNLQLNNVKLLQSDLFEKLPSDALFSLITANPPYISSSEFQQLPALITKHEPGLALLAGSQGLDIIIRIIAEAPPFMLHDASIILEIGCTQAAAVQQILQQAGWRDIRIEADHAGLERFAIAKRPLKTAP